MATVVSSQSLAAGASVSSSSTSYVASSVVVATVLNGGIGPGQGCQAQLFLSVDNVNFKLADTRTFGMAPSTGYSQVFELSNYAGASPGAQPNALQILGGVTLWTNFKLTFVGTPDQAVTVAAISAP